jgi:hypothetical protein
MPVILPRLAGGRLATAAVEALGIAAAGTGRDDVVEAVRRAGPDSRGPRRIIEALLRVGGNAGRRGLVEYVRSFDVMNAVWALRGITPAAALDRLAALGIVDRGDRAAASSNVMEEDLRLRPYGVAFGELTAHYVVALYDAEASQVPCGHASSELLLQLEDDDEPLQRTLDALTV